MLAVLRLFRSQSEALLQALLQQPELLTCEGDGESAWQRFAGAALQLPDAREQLRNQLPTLATAERAALAHKYLESLPMAAQVS